VSRYAYVYRGANGNGLGGRSKAARNRSRSRSVIFSNPPPLDYRPSLFLTLKGFAIFFCIALS